MSDAIETKRATVVELLSPALKSKQVWADWADAFATVMSICVENPIEQLETCRNIDGTDPELMKETARMLGFDLTQDVLNLSEENLLKLVTSLGQYPDINGTRCFVYFLGLLLNAKADLQNLWTEDYEEFLTSPSGKLLIDGGSWYKTTHVDLEVAMTSVAGIQLDGKTLFQRIVEIFNSQAPLSLVLHSLYFAINERFEVAFGMKMASTGEERLMTISNKGQFSDVDNNEYWP